MLHLAYSASIGGEALFYPGVAMYFFAVLIILSAEGGCIKVARGAFLPKQGLARIFRSGKIKIFLPAKYQSKKESM